MDTLENKTNIEALLNGDINTNYFNENKDTIKRSVYQHEENSSEIVISKKTLDFSEIITADSKIDKTSRDMQALSSGNDYGVSLLVKSFFQERPGTCWAASSMSIAYYYEYEYGNVRALCNYVHDNKHNSSDQCPGGVVPWSIYTALNDYYRIGVYATDATGYTHSKVRREIDRWDTPVIANMKSKAGGGHAVIISGFTESADGSDIWYYIRDNTSTNKSLRDYWVQVKNGSFEDINRNTVNSLTYVSK